MMSSKSQNAVSRSFILILVFWVTSFVSHGQTVSNEISIPYYVDALEWSPDGQLLAVSGSTGLHIYTSSLQEVAHLQQTKTNLTTSISWKFDSQQLATVGNGEIFIWTRGQNDSFSLLNTVNITGYLQVLVSWSPDGTKLASQDIPDVEDIRGQLTNIHIWNTNTWLVEQTLPEQYSYSDNTRFLPVALKWDASSSFIAGSGKDDVEGEILFISDINSGFRTLTLTQVTQILAFDWSNQGLLSIGAFDLAIYDTNSHHYLFTFVDLHEVRNLQWSPTGDKLLINKNTTTQITDITTGSLLVAFPSYLYLFDWSNTGNNIASVSIDASTNNRLLQIREVSSFSVPSIPTLTPYPTIPPTLAPTPTPSLPATIVPNNPILGVTLPSWDNYYIDIAINPAENLLAIAGFGQEVAIYSATTLIEQARLVGHTDNVITVDWNPVTGKLASGGRDKTVKIWDIALGTSVTLSQHDGRVIALSWSPNGTSLSTLDAVTVARYADGTTKTLSTLRVWTIESQIVLQAMFTDLTDAAQVIEWSADSSKVAVFANSTSYGISIFDAATLQLEERITGLGIEGRVISFDWNENNSLFAVGSILGGIQVWGRDGSLINASDTGIGISSVSWYGNDKLVVTTNESQVLIWQPLVDKFTTLTNNQTQDVLTVAQWNSTGNRVIAGGSNGSLRIWDTSTLPPTNNIATVTPIATATLTLSATPTPAPILINQISYTSNVIVHHEVKNFIKIYENNVIFGVSCTN